MSNKRMNHVFNEMVVKAGRDIDTAELQFINGGVSATFFCTQQAIHAAHAINNHDRMVEEIAELKGALREARGALSACSIQESRNDGSENRMKIKALDKQVYEIDSLLSKLNQEGGE